MFSGNTAPVPQKQNHKHTMQCLKAKLLYGLESIELPQGVLKKLQTFQVKGLRQIMGMTTTFGQMQQGSARTNTNEEAFRQVIINFETFLANKTPNQTTWKACTPIELDYQTRKPSPVTHNQIQYTCATAGLQRSHLTTASLH